jgi:hypothetical protein
LNFVSETGFVENRLHKVDFRAFVAKFIVVFHIFHSSFTNGFIAASTAPASHTHAATGIFNAFSYRF